MTSLKENIPREEKAKQFDFGDLQPILQKSLDDKKLQVINFTATNFVPLGENFGSLMVKLDVKIRRGNSTKLEDLHLLAKTMNVCDKPLIVWTDSVRKEVFMFSELRSAYRNLEAEAGVPENKLIDFLPKFYGHRNSLKEGSNEYDDDAFFLMENMKVTGYRNVDKKIGLSRDHAEITLMLLARYHALGIALKQKKPKIFEKALIQCDVPKIDVQQMDDGFKNSLKVFRADPIFAKHLSIIELTHANAANGKIFENSGEEPWLTITHGDLWINNILYHHDKNDKVDDVKLVDFQIFAHNTPLKDIAHFLLSNVKFEVLDRALDDLLCMYYKKFIESLKLLKCDTKHYSMDSFHKELKKQAIFLFPLIVLIRKFYDYEVTDESDSSKLINNALTIEYDDNTRKIFQTIVGIYEKRCWF